MMINLDIASGTRTSIPALFAYVVTTFRFPGNPNARHELGERARKELSRLKKRAGMALGVSSGHLVYTSGGTEANALAVVGTIRNLRERNLLPEGAEVVISAAEHASLTELAGILKEWGVTLKTVPLDTAGLVRSEDLLNTVTDRTVLVSIAALFGEVGVMPAIRDMFTTLRTRERKTPLILHTDASQAAWCHDISPQRLAADLVTIDAQKMYGPKGIGALLGPGVQNLAPIFGGSVLRPGTPPLPLIAAFTAAVEASVANRKERNRSLGKIRSELIRTIMDVFPNALVPTKRSGEGTHIIPIGFPGVDAEYLATYLSQRGILTATRSACSEGEEAPAYRMLFNEHAQSVIRFSFDESCTRESRKRLRYALSAFKKLVDRGVGRTYSEATTYAD